MQQGIDKGSVAARVLCCARSGVHHHSGGLVYDCEIVVLVDHIEWNRLGHGFERRGVWFARDDDVLTTAQLERSLLRLAIDEQVTLLDEHLHTRAAYAFELCGCKVVETLARRRGENFNFMLDAHAVPRGSGGYTTLRSRSTSAPAITSKIAAICGPSSAPWSNEPRPSGSRQSSVM